MISTKLLTKDLINGYKILNGKIFFFRKFQNHLVFIPAKKYINFFSDTTRINSWKSSGMPEENIENITKSHSNFVPTSVDHRVIT